jgi:hypothetical protein
MGIGVAVLALLLPACGDLLGDSAVVPGTGTCEAAVDTGAAVVSTETTSDVGLSWLVCSGGTLTLATPGATAWVAPGGSVDATADDVEVWARAGATVTLSGAGATLFYEDGATVTAAGEGAVATACSTVEFEGC